jgi:hypothetical protein
MGYKTTDPLTLVSLNLTCYGCMTGSYYRDSFTPLLDHAPKFYIGQLPR